MNRDIGNNGKCCNIGNNLFLGIVIFFVTLGTVQLFLPHLLPMSVYFYVAFASFELSVLELIKVLSNQIVLNYLKRKEIAKVEEQLVKRQLEIKKRTEVLCHGTDKDEEYIYYLKSVQDSSKDNRRIHVLGQFVQGITVVQVFLLVVQFALTIVKIVPENIYTEKVIGILTLFSFANVFLSYYLIQANNADMNCDYCRFDIYHKTTRFYLDMLDSATKDNDNSEN